MSDDVKTGAANNVPAPEGQFAAAFAAARSAKESGRQVAAKKMPSFGLPSRAFRTQIEERRKMRDALILRGKNLVEAVLDPLPEEVFVLVAQRDDLVAQMQKEIAEKGPTARLAFEGELKQYDKFLEGYLEGTFDPNLQPHERAAVKERAGVAYILCRALALSKREAFPGDVIRLLEGSIEKNLPEDKFSALALGVVTVVSPEAEAVIKKNPRRRDTAVVIILNRKKSFLFQNVVAGRLAVAAAKKVLANPDIQGFPETIRALWAQAVQRADAKHAAAEREMRKGLSLGATFHDLMDQKEVVILLRDPGEEVGDRIYRPAEIKVASDGTNVWPVDAEGRGAGSVLSFVKRGIRIPQKYFGDSFLKGGGQRPDLAGAEFAFWATVRRAIQNEANLATLKAESVAKFEAELTEAALRGKSHAAEKGIAYLSEAEFQSGRDGVAAVYVTGAWYDKERDIKVYYPVIVVSRHGGKEGQKKITLVATIGNASKIFEGSSVCVGGEYYESDAGRAQPYSGCAWPLRSVLWLHSSQLSKRMKKGTDEEVEASSASPAPSSDALTTSGTDGKTLAAGNPTPFSCPKCNFIAKNKGGLTAHMKKHE
ncbi:MAG: hypothetical protein HYS74_01810 [Parcubacteria group bacterium]|nr:hypothetical protein [Parcubacteria group bacterium]